MRGGYRDARRGIEAYRRPTCTPTVKEGLVSDAKAVLEQAIDLWNRGDREGWTALYTDDVEWEAPGGVRISGLDNLKVKYFDALLEAAPDRASIVDVLIAEGDLVAEEGRYTGTHTGTWRSPDGVEIPATGRRLDFRFSAIFRVDDGKIASIRLYYDQVEVLSQLGLMPAPTPA
jgi:steroid delta-isomerase-like uncharacterized protein